MKTLTLRLRMVVWRIFDTLYIISLLSVLLKIVADSIHAFTTIKKSVFVVWWYNSKTELLAPYASKNIDMSSLSLTHTHTKFLYIKNNFIGIKYHNLKKILGNAFRSLKFHRTKFIFPLVRLHMRRKERRDTEIYFLFNLMLSVYNLADFI